MGTRTALPTADSLRIIAVPEIGSGLTPEQIRGDACVWGATPLHSGTGIDLGPRHGTFMGQSTIWHPRACRPCLNRAARAEYEGHRGVCEQCVDDAALCETRHTLRRIVLETQ